MPLFLAHLHPQSVMDALDGSVVSPSSVVRPDVIVGGKSWGRSLQAQPVRS